MAVCEARLPTLREAKEATKAHLAEAQARIEEIGGFFLFELSQSAYRVGDDSDTRVVMPEAKTNL